MPEKIAETAYKVFGPKGCLERATKIAILLVIAGASGYCFGIKVLSKLFNVQTTPEPPAMTSPLPIAPTVAPAELTQIGNCTTKQPGQTTWETATSLGDPNTIGDYSAYDVTYPNGQQFILNPGNWDTHDTGQNATGVRNAPAGSTICAEK